MAKKRLTGQVVSDKMKNTVVVKVERIKEHPKYKRRYKVHKKYKAHDQNQECKIGDRVVIEECRPISKEKCWRVIEKMPGRAEAEETDLFPEIEPSLEAKREEEGDNKENI